MYNPFPIKESLPTCAAKTLDNLFLAVRKALLGTSYSQKSVKPLFIQVLKEKDLFFVNQGFTPLITKKALQVPIYKESYWRWLGVCKQV